jgi:hypothetical protein
MLLHIYRKVKKNTSVSANILEKGKVVSASRQNIYFYLGYTRCKIYWAKLEGPRGSDFNFVIKSLRRHEKLGSIPKV